ncbi:MAG: outer membrane protein transport protein [Acidobacteria bacterium]|jgi:long-chain fatty acid transport protein|nr:outer membrane protein transport protein [Acidobacteriota bacterium]
MFRCTSRVRPSICLSLLFLGLAAAGPSLAGGLTLYEIGTPDLGLAAAGYAARAQDPGTVLTNPAGMTRLAGSQLLVGGQLLYGSLEFEANSSTTTSGGNGGNAVGFFPAASLFYTHQLSPKATFGFGVFSNFGLGLDYAEGWAGRYYAQKATLIGVSAMPAIAFKVSDTVSLGVALNAMYGLFDTTVAINNINPTLKDGGLALKDESWGFGGNAGLLWEPSQKTRFGVTYSSPLKLDFKDAPEFSGLGPVVREILARRGLLGAQLELGVTVPQGAMASFYRQVQDDWAILGNVGWQDWSAFGRIDVGLATTAPRDLTVEIPYKDTWHAALGAQHVICDPWTLNFGMAYDSSFVDAADRSPALPLGAAWRFGVGAGYKVRESLAINFATEFLWGGSPGLDVERGPLAGRLAGEYPDTWMAFANVNATWKF